MEEVGRMIGYSSITPESPLLPAVVPPKNEERVFLHGLRKLVAAQGFHEVYNYSFLSEETVRHFGWTPEEHVKVLNPIAADQGLMRKSLVPEVWKNIVDNSRFSDEFRLFEIGREIHKREGDLPLEVNHMCAAVYFKESGAQGLFELKRLAECGLRVAKCVPPTAVAYEHPARTAEIVYMGESIGRLFEFHPSMVKGRGSVLDVDIDALMRLCPHGGKYSRFVDSRRALRPFGDRAGTCARRRHPASVDCVSGSDLGAHRVRAAVFGRALAEGTKSVSYRLLWRPRTAPCHPTKWALCGRRSSMECVPPGLNYAFENRSMEQQSKPENKIDYIEMPATDITRTQEFYTAVFGWKFEDYGPEYTSFSDGRLSGGFSTEYKTPSRSMLVVIYASDLAAIQAKIVAAGGAVTREIFSFPGGKRFHFADPNGNELAVWSDAP